MCSADILTIEIIVHSRLESIRPVLRASRTTEARAVKYGERNKTRLSLITSNSPTKHKAQAWAGLRIGHFINRDHSPASSFKGPRLQHSLQCWVPDPISRRSVQRSVQCPSETPKASQGNVKQSIHIHHYLQSLIIFWKIQGALSGIHRHTSMHKGLTSLSGVGQLVSQRPMYARVLDSIQHRLTRSIMSR